MSANLKTGDSAYWDTFAGLVQVKVTAIKTREGVRTPYHGPSSDTRVDFEVTKDHGPYRRGERQTDHWSIHVVPKAAIVRRKYSTGILFYTVTPDGGRRESEV